jgi:hypothetical protein
MDEKIFRYREFPKMEIKVYVPRFAISKFGGNLVLYRVSL